jgi:hypothetical protein
LEQKIPLKTFCQKIPGGDAPGVADLPGDIFNSLVHGELWFGLKFSARF